MTAAGSIEQLLRRDRRVTALGLVVLCGLAWAYLVSGAGMGVSLAEMTTTSLLPHTLPEPGREPSMGALRSSPAHLPLMVSMWWVMMIAMMTPSAAPMILLHARVARDAHQKGKDPHGALDQTAVFAGGYLLVWLGFSVAATALQAVLEAGGLLSGTTMRSLHAELSAAVLVTAGVYQLTPLKRACLRHCRTPVQFLSRHWRPGRRGAVRLGALHGAYCVGCCGVLMALLFVGGVMNPLWIAALASIVLVEKLAGGGVLVSRGAGGALVAWGVVALALSGGPSLL